MFLALIIFAFTPKHLLYTSIKSNNVNAEITNNCYIAATKEGYEKMANYLAVKNTDGLKQMLMHNEITPIQQGTKVIILKRDTTCVFVELNKLGRSSRYKKGFVHPEFVK